MEGLGLPAPGGDLPDEQAWTIDAKMPPNDDTAKWPPRMADDDRKRKGDQNGPGTAVITKTRPQTKRPNLYRVLLLNDDYTPMEFVVHVLERFFNKDHEAAHTHHDARAPARDRRVWGVSPTRSRKPK